MKDVMEDYELHAAVKTKAMENKDTERLNWLETFGGDVRIEAGDSHEAVWLNLSTLRAEVDKMRKEWS